MTKPVVPKTVPYSEYLFSEVMKHQLDYLQTGETVCGAEDPAVITLGDSFGTAHPEYSGLTVCRVTERYVSPWKSDTFLEFSTEEATATEYSASYALMGDDD